ncbi:hypothetical protein JDV02_006928 [Purpureocillium takamizusanense]|uniref:Uncharacterized protein n=1 Tax=Purpureocillium takamizusanense TaxID=2060973 RepID=A0A9Q8QLD0_9HYPO|nr:uncharacterized protein JDV02_006928 [Purpureocillium takamizusanense]UNI20879.1 hypothetical protein JDV02_006928 [Purpureocillium takamizusanense]
MYYYMEARKVRQALREVDRVLRPADMGQVSLLCAGSAQQQQKAYSNINAPPCCLLRSYAADPIDKASNVRLLPAPGQVLEKNRSGATPHLRDGTSISRENSWRDIFKREDKELLCSPSLVMFDHQRRSVEDLDRHPLRRSISRALKTAATAGDNNACQPKGASWEGPSGYRKWHAP